MSVAQELSDDVAMGSTRILFNKLRELADAKGGTDRLRELILQLAVQGKLVPQDPDDEPIAVTLGHLETDENDSNLPIGWSYFELRQLGEFFGGSTPSKSRSAFWGGDIPWVSPKDMKTDFIQGAQDYITEAAVENTSIRLIPPSSILIVARSGILKHTLPVSITSVSCTINQDLKCIVLNPPHIPRYIQLLLRGNQAFIIKQLVKTGTTVQSLMYREFERQKFPLPPLAEQKRIVAKVDELMALCDQLEQQREHRVSVRETASKACLEQLTTTESKEELATAWHRLSDHFESLYDTPETVQQLRQSILELAVQGKLVPQDPDDEPAEVCFAKIQHERQTLAAECKWRRDSPPAPVEKGDFPFKLPSNWIGVRAAQLCYPISSGSTPPKSVFTDTGIPYLKVYNIRDQVVNFEYRKQFIDVDYHNKRMQRSSLVPGTVLLNIVGPPLGKTAIVPYTSNEWNCNQAIAFFRLVGDTLPQYVHLYFMAGLFLKDIALVGTAGQDNISVTKCKNIPIPLPPLAEQKRIAAKVDELMALCDQLEQKVTHRQETTQRLLEATVATVTNEAN